MSFSEACLSPLLFTTRPSLRWRVDRKIESIRRLLTRILERGPKAGISDSERGGKREGIEVDTQISSSLQLFLDLTNRAGSIWRASSGSSIISAHLTRRLGGSRFRVVSSGTVTFASHLIPDSATIWFIVTEEERRGEKWEEESTKREDQGLGTRLPSFQATHFASQVSIFLFDTRKASKTQETDQEGTSELHLNFLSLASNTTRGDFP